MDQDKYFLERKYSKFTSNMKISLKKALASGNIELADMINTYLDVIEELQYVNTLKQENDVKTYSDDIKIYEKKLENLQKKILHIQFNSPANFNEDNIVLDIPKFKDDGLNYIFMFIYKFLRLNSKSICIILHNFIDDLFNLNIISNTKIEYNSNKNTTITIEELCKSNILNGISIVYNKKLDKVQYIYKKIYSDNDLARSAEFKKSEKVLNKLLDRINKFKVNDFFNKTENKINPIDKLIEPQMNIIDDSNNIIYDLNIEDNTNEDTLIDNQNKLNFNNNTNKELKITLAIILIDILKSINCVPELDLNIGYLYYKQKLDIIKSLEKETNKYFLENNQPTFSKRKWRNMTSANKTVYTNKFNELILESWENLPQNEKIYYTKEIYKIKGKSTEKLSKTKLKTQICNYLTLNPKYNLEKEYNLLYNYFLTRDLDGKENVKKSKESNMNLIIPKFSLSMINNIVILIYLFIKNNKNDICNNLLKLLKQIKNKLVKQTYTFYDDGRYYYSDNKILSLCSSSVNAHNLINTFYLKYKEYDKILISNLLLQIIEKDCLKIKYDLVADEFSVVIINQDNLNIDFNKIDKSKLLEGLNNDLKCINEEINKNFIVKLINIIRENLNKVINIITDLKLMTSIFNLSTESARVYGLLKSKNSNFKVRKLLVIILIKFLIVHISKFYLDPNSTEFNMYDSIVTDIHKHICEKLTVEFGYNIYERMEQLYEEFPSYDI